MTDRRELIQKRANADFANRGEQISAAIAWVHDDLGENYANSDEQVRNAALMAFKHGLCQGYYPTVLRKALWNLSNFGHIDRDSPNLYTLDD